LIALINWNIFLGNGACKRRETPLLVNKCSQLFELKYITSVRHLVLSGAQGHCISWCLTYSHHSVTWSCPWIYWEYYCVLCSSKTQRIGFITFYIRTTGACDIVKKPSRLSSTGYCYCDSVGAWVISRWRTMYQDIFSMYTVQSSDIKYAHG